MLLTDVFNSIKELFNGNINFYRYFDDNIYESFTASIAVDKAKCSDIIFQFEFFWRLQYWAGWQALNY